MDWLVIYEIARVVFILLDIVLFALFMYLVLRGLEFRPRLRPDLEPAGKAFTLGEAVLRERWEATKSKFSVGSPEMMRLAIIEADRLTDDVLRRLGLEGEHMADRLEKLTPDDLKSLGGLWRAHRVRNDIVHTPDYEISSAEAERVMSAYEEFFKEIGILE